MCVVSAIGDKWSRPDMWPNWPQTIPFPDTSPRKPIGLELNEILLRKEIDRLTKKVSEMKKELEAAKAQDIANGNPDCEMDEKVIILRKIADMFGIELKEIFPND
jgi:hypothetical protein